MTGGRRLSWRHDSPVGLGQLAPARGLVLHERANAGHGSLMNPGQLSVALGNFCRAGSGRPLSEVSAAVSTGMTSSLAL